LYHEAVDAFLHLPSGAFDQADNGALNKCYVYAVTGDKTKAMELFKQIPQETKSMYPYDMSYVHLAFGEVQKSLDYLELAYQSRCIQMINIHQDPIFDPVRNQPRFREVTAKLN